MGSTLDARHVLIPPPKHTEVKEEGMEVEEGEMGEEDAPAPW